MMPIYRSGNPLVEGAVVMPWDELGENGHISRAKPDYGQVEGEESDDWSLQLAGKIVTIRREIV
jgi:hypothetical protein